MPAPHLAARAVTLLSLLAAACGGATAPATTPETKRPAIERASGEHEPAASHGDEASEEDPVPRDASDAPAGEPAFVEPTWTFRAPMPLVADPPSSRYAELSGRDCLAEIERRKLPFARSKQAAGGVATPLRSTGPIAGVRIAIPRAPSPFGIVDCRLALALADLAELAAEHGVVAMRIDNVHRPKAKLPVKGRKPSQHAYGLAADIVSFTLKGGEVLGIESEWQAPLGSVACGPSAVIDDPTLAAIALRNLVCEAARRSLFHHMLSPSSDAAHRDHLHADIKRGATRQPMR